jgi:hypothetical protein
MYKRLDRKVLFSRENQHRNRTIAMANLAHERKAVAVGQPWIEYEGSKKTENSTLSSTISKRIGGLVG